MSYRWLILGATGMLGHACLRAMAEAGDEVTGTVRTAAAAELLPEEHRRRLLTDVDADEFASVERAIVQTRPDIVINCIGVVKQLPTAADPLVALPLNALFPHRLARFCATAGARLVHVSTDCVFSGERGLYRETDRPDAGDLYGVSKRLGEVDYPNAITLRTSIIGHELAGARSLIDWFLAQKGPVNGFTRAIFSGLPTAVLARIIRDHVAPAADLRGLYHVSADPISKYHLLRLVAEAYDRTTEIRPLDTVVIDRSLDSSRFRVSTGWSPHSWEELVAAMRKDADGLIRNTRS